MISIEQQIEYCFYKPQKFKLKDLVAIVNGKIHIHKFIPNNTDELTAKFEAKCTKCGYTMSHNW